MRSLSSLFEKLGVAQSNFFRAADGVRVEQWSTCPGEGEWSTAEIVAHLVMVERAIIGGADRVTQSPPQPIPLVKRVHLPLWLVESRIVRRKTPIPLDTQLLGRKEEMLGELRGVRERTLAFLEETKGRNLSAYRWPHPFIGMLNTYEWFEMIAAHQMRHTKQVRKLSARLPKVVGISQS